MTIWLVTLILVVAMLLLITEKLPVDLTSIGIIIVLTLTGILAPKEAIAGFANPAVITVGAMFLISKGMIRTGLKADFVILSQDPMTTDTAEVRDIDVVETIKGGKVIYSAKPQLANPSASFCTESGGTYEIRDGNDGKAGICILEDGSEVDAWDYFRENAG